MKYDLVIIGSGPAGYIAAARAGQTGLKTVVIEDRKIGGMCLNWGCIPTKSLMESAKKLSIIKKADTFGIEGITQNQLNLNWSTLKKRTESITSRLGKGIGFLFKKNGVEYIEGRASITGSGLVQVGDRIIETENIVIATGSVPELPEIPVPSEEVVEVYDLLKMDKLPERPVIIGSGPHAMELAQFFALIGKKVFLLPEDRDFLEHFDTPLVEFALKTIKDAGVEILEREKLTGYSKGNLEFGDSNIETDMLLNCGRRRAVIPDSVPELDTEDGFLKVDEKLSTSYPGIYAIGDVNGLSSFAHIASAQGVAVVNNINGIIPLTVLDQYPVNMYTYPEIAQIGKTEKELKFRDIKYSVTKIPFASNGKAIIEDQKNGFIRILSEKEFGEILGIQIVAENATDMIAEAAALIQLEGTVYDLSTVVHSHPTVSEVFMDGGFAAFEEMDK